MYCRKGHKGLQNTRTNIENLLLDPVCEKTYLVLSLKMYPSNTNFVTWFSAILIHKHDNQNCLEIKLGLLSNQVQLSLSFSHSISFYFNKIFACFGPFLMQNGIKENIKCGKQFTRSLFGENIKFDLKKHFDRKLFFCNIGKLRLQIVLFTIAYWCRFSGKNLICFENFYVTKESFFLKLMHFWKQQSQV